MGMALAVQVGKSERKIRFGKEFKKFFSPEDIIDFEGKGEYTPEKAETKFRRKFLEGPLVLPLVVFETAEDSWKQIPARLTSFERNKYVRIAQKELSQKRRIRSWQILWVPYAY